MGATSYRKRSAGQPRRRTDSSAETAKHSNDPSSATLSVTVAVPDAAKVEVTNANTGREAPKATQLSAR